MAQFSQLPVTDVRRALDDVLAHGINDVRVAVEPGEIRHGRIISCKTSPQIICCLYGEASYFVQNVGREQAVTLRKNDLLLVTGGAWLGVAPEQPYISLGILLYPEITHSYLIQPARAGSSFPKAQMTALFPRRRRTRGGNSIFTRMVYTDIRDTGAVAGPEHLALIRAMVAVARRDAGDPFLRALATALLTGCRQLLEAKQSEATSKARSTFEAVCAEIALHCDEPLDRRRIAVAQNIHPNHLTKLFSEFSELTFTEHLMATRLRRARALIEEGRLNVSEAAIACGFSSANYFVRSFRKAFGHTPGRHGRSLPSVLT